MAVLHDYECRAHGVFESRAKEPRCPHGCSKSFVSRVFLQPISIGTAKVANADRMLRGAAESQGLSDVSTSPSRPGDSVMARLRARHNKEFAREQVPNWGGEQGRVLSQLDPKTILAGAKSAGGEDVMANLGMGKKYDAKEWRTTEDGRRVHIPSQKYPGYRPPAEVERTKGGDS